MLLVPAQNIARGWREAGVFTDAELNGHARPNGSGNGKRPAPTPYGHSEHEPAGR
jgi:hypothetical protein